MKGDKDEKQKQSQEEKVESKDVLRDETEKSLYSPDVITSVGRRRRRL